MEILKMKIIPLSILVVLLSVTLLSCENSGKEKLGQSEHGRIGFLVEPQCESQVRQYMDKINKIHGFKSGMYEINHNHNAVKSFNYFGFFESSKLNKKELEGYVNGAMRNCRANREFTFDLRNRKSILEFIEFINYESNKNPSDPMFFSYKDGELVVVYIGNNNNRGQTTFW
jgi:hypothetical protein